MLLKPITSEKAVKMIDLDNSLLFELERKYNKIEIKKEVESVFSVKVDSVRTMIRGNKKYAYVKLKKENLAADVATKLGVI
ncbi:50S ribosomal protein L23 [Candidatus Pacearchaeota archaeon CG10_big_fil_rev_8_21_14_0_10_31_24]|nr:MAG: 50S ribosomal protein L23 [Candidatus Pacearchaeota archaeon CG10_big_fil_rev_8_21_14_0_10_31_24]